VQKGHRVSSPAIERAKRLAKLLRTDLAAAGISISQSSALELIAHQHGAKDWNTFSAISHARPVAVGGTAAGEEAIEVEWVRHTGRPMTVGELRAAMTGLPDDVPVLVSHPDEAGDDAARILIHGSSARVRPNPYGSGRALAIDGELPPGSYQRARRLTLTVTGLPTGDDGTVAHELVNAVEAATAPLNHRGATSVEHGPESATVSWTWTARNVALAVLAGTARQAIQRHDPGHWILAETSGSDDAG
jgi:hypothetical protein